MKQCNVDKIRNFVVAGHLGCGKTTLADRILHKSGAVNRLGEVDQGTSVSDFRPEEHEKRSSIYNGVLNCSWNEHGFFFIDTPGYADYFGETVAAISQADAALIVVDGAVGIDMGTIRAWKEAVKRNIPRAFFINCLDRDQAKYEEVLGQLQNSYGATTCIPFTVPVGSGESLSSVVHVLRDTEIPSEVSALVEKYRESLMDTIAETDEELMNKYLEGEELSEQEISAGLHQAIVDGDIVPVFAGSAGRDVGVEQLMNGIANLFPSPLMIGGPALAEGGELTRSADGKGVGFVFKTISDPFIGQLTLLRVYSGEFTSDSDAFNVSNGSKERFGSLLHLNGKEQEVAEKAVPGQIVAIAKLKHTAVNQTLAGAADAKPVAPVEFPNPTLSYAIYAVKSGEEEKIAAGIMRLSEEDPTINLERNPETHETVLSGMGDQHIQNIVHRLRNTFKVEVDLRTPKVPYRETITSTGSAVYRHKKQTGGHGQFAEVHLRLEPLPEENFEFANEVVGGNIPKNFIPAVEKGVNEAMVKGPLAGCTVINIKAVVFDGKHHPVDSSEMAFKIAARGAFREAMHQARPQLLEPIMVLNIMFPDEYMGDISGDLNSRRGRILGMNREEGLQVVTAEVPLAEVFNYSNQLRSITQGRGSFEMRFERYETVPANLAQQIQAQAVKDHEED